MTTTTLSSREFNQDVGRAKQAAQQGPVFITDHGKRAHVLLSIAEYQRLIGARDLQSLTDALAAPGLSDIEFEPARLTLSSQATEF
ncbi:MAG: type II toxin-antitoxin system Phd/YefM family antitoxin [Chromatiaceae bacterium]|nr:type II toxin-antitoxin system Phd/YefM family antitoxin [Chromatiaceae bacterium]